MTKAEHPSNTRFLIVGATTLVAVLLYLDRFCISIAEVYIKQDLGLTDTQVGWMLSAFFWTYALAQVPSGWLTDRFGARIMLTSYVAVWSLFTAGTGLVGGFLALLLLRFGFGLGQAGAYPTSAALLSRWVPLAARGTASSVVSLGGRIGGALAPLLTGLAIVAFVPVSTSSLLQSTDLIHVGLLAKTTFGPDSMASSDDRLAELRSWLIKNLSPANQTRLRILADFTGPVLGNEDLTTSLAEDLNRLIRSRETAKQTFFDREALPRQGQKLSQRDPASLPQAELERLNRLLLETAFPDSIRRLYTAGWRPVMLVYGLIGIPIAIFFWVVFRDRPVQHPRCNESEIELIALGLPAEQTEPQLTASRVPLVPLLTNLSMWLNCLMQWATNVGWVFLVTWLPRYLVDVHHVPVERRAVMTLIPVVVGFAGMILGGRSTDRLVGRLGPRWGRALPIALSRFLAMGAYLLCLLHPSPWLAVVLFSLVAFGTDFGVGAVWAYVQDVGGRHVGSVLGWGNMWGNLGAALTPPLLIWVVGEEHDWNLAFLTCAAAFLVAGLAGLGIDATSRIDDPNVRD